MTAFSQLKQADGTRRRFRTKGAATGQATIAMVDRELAGSLESVRDRFGAAGSGRRRSADCASTRARRSAADLRRAADRAEMVPAIESYMASLDAAMLASSTGGDTQAALTKFDASRQELQRRLADTDIAPDVSKGVNTMIGAGQALMDKVTANSIGLRDRVQAYTPILLTAEDAINGSVRVDDERIRAETLGLSRAVGARGQMMMQQLLVNLGGELPEPELRTSMNTRGRHRAVDAVRHEPGARRRLARGAEAAGKSSSSGWRSCPTRPPCWSTIRT